MLQPAHTINLNPITLENYFGSRVHLEPENLQLPNLWADIMDMYIMKQIVLAILSILLWILMLKIQQCSKCHKNH